MEQPKVTVYPPAYAYGYKENSWDLLRASPGMFRDLYRTADRVKTEKRKNGYQNT